MILIAAISITSMIPYPSDLERTKESSGAGSPSPESEVAMKTESPHKLSPYNFIHAIVDTVQSATIKKSLQLLGETVGCVGRKTPHLACHHRSYETGKLSGLRHLKDFSKSSPVRIGHSVIFRWTPYPGRLASSDQRFLIPSDVLQQRAWPLRGNDSSWRPTSPFQRFHDRTFITVSRF
jgi:hypothetical protein